MTPTTSCRARLPLLAAACLCLGTPAWAQSSPQKGDVIHLDVNLDFKQRERVNGGDVKTVCFRKGASFEVVDADESVIRLTRRSRWSVTAAQQAPLRKACDDAEDLGDPDADAHIYTIRPLDLKPNYYRHRGITHGALFVPFKRRYDKSLSGESNLGYYLGYRFGGPLGVSITPAASVGLSIVNVSDDSKVSGSTTLADRGTRPAFTWTAGFILNHLDAFQVGLFVGRDRIGGDVGRAWKFENRTWSSIAFGYAFGR